jgi:hypothetical protein
MLLTSVAALCRGRPRIVRSSVMIRPGVVRAHRRLHRRSPRRRQSGLKTTFTYTVELRQDVPAWVDRTIATSIVTISVQYDNLTRRATLVRTVDAHVDSTETTEDDAVIRQWMTRFQKMPLFRTAELEQNREYYVRVGATARPTNGSMLWPWGSGISGITKFTFSANSNPNLQLPTPKAMRRGAGPHRHQQEHRRTRELRLAPLRPLALRLCWCHQSARRIVTFCPRSTPHGFDDVVGHPLRDFDGREVLGGLNRAQALRCDASLAGDRPHGITGRIRFPSSTDEQLDVVPLLGGRGGCSETIRT